MSIGYTFNDINIGINYGISINKFKYAQDMTKSITENDNPKIDKNVWSVLPYLGIGIEKKFKAHDVYIHIDHIFKKKRLESVVYIALYENT